MKGSRRPGDGCCNRIDVAVDDIPSSGVHGTDAGILKHTTRMKSRLSSQPSKDKQIMIKVGYDRQEQLSIKVSFTFYPARALMQKTVWPVTTAAWRYRNLTEKKFEMVRLP